MKAIKQADYMAKPRLFEALTIDVSKLELEIYSEKHTELSGTYKNDIDTIREFLIKLSKADVRNMIVCEGTGGYETELRLMCHYYDIPCQIMNGARIREFAKARGQFSKTDKIDARMIHNYAAILFSIRHYKLVTF